MPSPADTTDRLDAVARDIAEQLLRLGNEPPAQLRVVDATEFDVKQRRHADRSAAALSAVGFRHLADVEALHLTPQLGRPTLLRLHVSPDATTAAASWQLPPKSSGLVQQLALRLARAWRVVSTVELKTAFDDGAFLLTSGLGDAAPGFGSAPQIHLEVLSDDVTVPDLVARHAARVNTYLAGRPGVSALRSPDVAAVEHIWAAESTARNAFRRSIGYVTDDELRRTLGKHYDTLGDPVRRHLTALSA